MYYYTVTYYDVYTQDTYQAIYSTRECITYSITYHKLIHNFYITPKSSHAKVDVQNHPKPIPNSPPIICSMTSRFSYIVVCEIS